MSLPSVDLSDLVVDAPENCFEWTGTKVGRGYGSKWPRPVTTDRPVYIHRFVYEICFGPIPPGLVVHHRCENKACANPLHLEVRTQRSNILDGDSGSAQNARKQHCSKCGGDFTVIKSGRRKCLPCSSAYMRDYYQRSKAESRA